MTKITRPVLFFLFVVGAVSGQDIPNPQLVSAQMPRYPALARATRTEGDVKVEFMLNSSGEPISVVAMSGHPLLRGAAEENIWSWRFKLPTDSYRSEWKYSTTFHFKIWDDAEPYEDAKLTVVLNSFNDVEVKTNRPSNQSAHECPKTEEAEPPAATQMGDFVKLSRSGCYGTCPAYDVTVFDSGEVTWNGTLFIQSNGWIHAKIDPAQAHALIELFLLPKFWALCKGYSASITDSSTTQIDVQIGGRGKTVRNYANSAPTWLDTFEDAIDAAANTHLWRHGEPRTEPLSNIMQDAYMPKPGVTPLMKAAMRSDTDSIRAAIARRDDVDAQDSSGWTALMYAAASSHSEPIQLLLQAGANPNHKSFAGDTSLMSSAISGQFDEDLFRAGAEINARNNVGVTALMILAARAEADEVKEALKAGADAFAKDAKGRSVLDYLRLANCGKSPIREWQMYDTGDKCDKLDKDDVRHTADTLKGAKRKRN